jgi:hypothetical protein
LVQAGLSFTPEVSSQAGINSEQCGVYSALIQAEFVDQFKAMIGTDVSLAVIYNETYDARPIDYDGDYDHELLNQKTLTLWRPELESSMPGLSRRAIEDFYARNGQPDTLCDSFDLSVGHVVVGRDELDNLSEQDKLAFDDVKDASGGDEVDSSGNSDPDEGQDASSGNGLDSLGNNDADDYQGATHLNSFQRKYSGAVGLICLSKAGFNARMDQALVYVEMLNSTFCDRAFFVWLTKEDGVWKMRDDMLAWIA